MNDIVNHIAEAVASALAQTSFQHPPVLVVAYSGGVDSSLLLHALHAFGCQSSIKIHAVHVHHGLSSNADDWSRHCENECKKLNIPFTSYKVSVATGARKSIEAEARNARYKVLLEYCQAHNGVLCLGQHGEDQLETMLLQLKRGAGPQGLAGMGAFQWRDGILMLRPMLSLQKSSIVNAANELNIEWVTDESNADNRYERNFLRNEIIPQLTKRWPQLTVTAGRSAQLIAEQNELITEQAQTYLNECLKNVFQLNIQKLHALSARWQRVVLRQWFIQHSTLLPSQAQLLQIQSMLNAKHDANPEVSFPWGKLARYNGLIYWIPKDDAYVPEQIVVNQGQSEVLAWLGLTVTITGVTDDQQITIKTKVTGLRVKPQSESLSKPLKQWFKQWKVPVWERSKVPVIFFNNEAVALVVHRQLVVLSTMPEQATIVLSGNND